MRTLLIVLLVIVAGVGGWMLFSPMRGEAGDVGVNTLVENDVTTASAGQDAWTASVVGGDVYFGDRIATAADSRLEVRLLDRSNLSVGANARLTIDRFVYDPSRNAAGAMVSVLTGAFRYASDEGKPEQVSFRTPGATIGIRGTVIEGVVGPEAIALIAGMTEAPDLSLDADSAAVIILRSGAADVRVANQTVVLDQPGQAVILTRKQVYPAFAVTPETTERFEALLPPSATQTHPADPSGGTPPLVTTGPRTPPPGATPPPAATPPVRQPLRDPGVRPQRRTTPQTRPAPGGQLPSGPQRAGPAGPGAGQPAPGGQGAAPGQPQAGLPQASQPQNQPQGAQPPAGNQHGAQTPPAGNAPDSAPSTTKPADSSGAQAQAGQSQPGQTQPNGDRPAGGQPSTTPPSSRPTQPNGTRPTTTQPQTQPRTQPVAPGGGGPRQS